MAYWTDLTLDLSFPEEIRCCITALEIEHAKTVMDQPISSCSQVIHENDDARVIEDVSHGALDWGVQI